MAERNRTLSMYVCSIIIVLMFRSVCQRSNVRIGYKAFCQFKPIIRPEHPVYRQKLFSDEALISHFLVLSLHRSPAGSESLERKTQCVTKNCVFAIIKAYGCTGIEQSTV